MNGNRGHHAARATIAASVAACLLFPSLSTVDAAEPKRPSAGRIAVELADAKIVRHPRTGAVAFVGARSDRHIARPAGLEASAGSEQVARAFLARYGALFGIRNQAGNVRLLKAKRADRGRRVVRFQQVHRGVPVIAGELNIELDAAGNLVSANGETSPAPDIDVTPVVRSRDAARVAVSATAIAHGVAAAMLHPSSPALWVYDPRLLDAPDTAGPRLVWRVEVRNDASAVDELVLVDAHTPVVTLQFNQARGVRQRFVCDSANLPASGWICSGGYARTETSGASAVTEVERAFVYAGQWYDFFQSRFGRDSYDASGAPLVTTVRFCDPAPGGGCMSGSFWAGQAVFSDGEATDDIVGHELTHGITTAEPNFYYYGQSGALDESFADIFGEFIDLSNTGQPMGGLDTAATRWQIGEELQPHGAFRSMKDPTDESIWGPRQPDRMTSPYFYSYPGDQYGVHYNSGVGNKAAYLIVDGATFNGQQVTGIGIAKAAAIYYEALTNHLTSGSDFRDMFDILPQSCSSLIGGAQGITSQDCLQVRDAVLATEMYLPPSVPGTNGRGEADRCAAGELPASPNVYLADFEPGTPTSAQWSASSTLWTIPTGSGTYATSGTNSWFATSGGSAAQSSLAMTADIANLPAGAFLHFRHSHDFYVDGTAYAGGGIVEYSTDAGLTWIDAGSLFDRNGYLGTVRTGHANPLEGKTALVGNSIGYYSSRLNLSSLAGLNVRFRFRIGIESSGPNRWYVDDVRVYTCMASDSVPPGGNIEFHGIFWEYPNATPTRDVELGLSATDPGGVGVQSMRISNTLAGLASAPWEPFQTTKAWTLSAGDGLKRTYVQFRDSAGNVSDSSFDEVLLDTTKPVIAYFRQALAAGSRVGSTVPVRVYWSASDSRTGIAFYALYRRRSTESFTVPFTMPRTATSKIDGLASSATTLWQYEVWAYDGVNNSISARSPLVKVRLFQETTASPTLTFSATGWTRATSTTLSGGGARRSRVARSYARFRFTGRNVGFVSTFGPNRGRYDVYLDGKRLDANTATTAIDPFDLYSATTVTRRIAFSRAVSTGVTHLLEIRVRGDKRAASTGTYVDVDAFALIQ